MNTRKQSSLGASMLVMALLLSRLERMRSSGGSSPRFSARSPGRSEEHSRTSTRFAAQILQTRAAGTLAGCVDRPGAELHLDDQSQLSRMDESGVRAPRK